MATWTTPTIHVTADNLSVTDYNAVASNTTFLYQTPFFNYYDSGGSTLTNNANTQVNLASTATSGYGFSLSSNNAIIPLTGVYQFSFTITLGLGSANGGEFVAILYHNGTATLQGGEAIPNSSANVASAGSGLIACSATDTIGLWGFQNSGGGITTNTGASKTFLTGYLRRLAVAAEY